MQKDIETEQNSINELRFAKTHRAIITKDKQETPEEEVKETSETIDTSDKAIKYTFKINDNVILLEDIGDEKN